MRFLFVTILLAIYTVTLIRGIPVVRNVIVTNSVSDILNGDIIDGLGNIVNGTLDTVKNLTNELIMGPLEDTGNMANEIGNLANGVTDTVGGIVSGGLDIVAGATGAIGNAIGNLWGVLG